VILPISISQVVRLTGVSHQCLAFVPFLLDFKSREEKRPTDLDVYLAQFVAEKIPPWLPSRIAQVIQAGHPLSSPFTLHLSGLTNLSIGHGNETAVH
jgi:hypothetical protein